MFATKRPETVPLRSGSASDVAEAMMNIFLKIGFPMKVLSDRGKVFLSKVVKQLYEQCRIDSISTSPYKPQSEDISERLHGTLKPMLAKAVDSGIDWVQYLTMALSAIRMVPNRDDTGLSPYELAYGRKFHDPLDVLYAGWVEERYVSTDVCTWVESLVERLKVLSETTVARNVIASRDRKLKYDKGGSQTEVCVLVSKCSCVFLVYMGC